MATIEDFEKTEIKTGTIVEAFDFEKARKPAYKLKIDFGDDGIKNSSAQITTYYTKDELIGKQILAVLNFPKMQIADFFSECLVLGVQEGSGIVLLTTERRTKNGLLVF